MSSLLKSSWPVLALLIGYGLIRLGSYLLRLYGEGFKRNPRVLMSLDAFSAIAVGPWSPIFAVAVACVCVGTVMTIIGVVECVALLLGFQEIG
jgi:hypothetical protein